MKLKDKIAIITGPKRGIGKAIALAYATEGANIVLASRDLEGLKKVAKETEALGVKAIPVKADISRSQDINRMVQEAIKEFGKIDILVNNAMDIPVPTPFLEISEEDWKYTIDVGLTGYFLCAQAVAKEMVKRRNGRIINITSGQGLIGIPFMAHYTACKGGIMSMTRCMASELSPLGITVNCISCGLTKTEFVEKNMPPDYQEFFAQSVALRRLGVPEDYVGFAVLLASDEGSYITGETIAVDGGVSTVVLGGPPQK